MWGRSRIKECENFKILNQLEIPIWMTDTTWFMYRKLTTNNRIGVDLKCSTMWWQQRLTSHYTINSKTSWLQGEELKKQIGAVAYIDCSAKTQQVCLKYALPANSNLITTISSAKLIGVPFAKNKNCSWQFCQSWLTKEILSLILERGKKKLKFHHSCYLLWFWWGGLGVAEMRYCSWERCESSSSIQC